MASERLATERLDQALRRLDALVDWERRGRAGMRVGLAPAHDLVERLGHPERAFRAVHVGGTKGKGSTSALIASALSGAGIRTGLYLSPHVERVHERIQVDRVPISDGELADALDRALAAREQAVAESTAADEATWFDVLTAAAFLHFARTGCAWAVIEVGLGGRLDSTNVVQGEVCVLTNVDLEHTQVLGSTLAAIAREKAGIVKPGSALVTGVEPRADAAPDDDAYGVIENIARAQGAALLRPAARAATLAEPTLAEKNRALARLALDELGRRGTRSPRGAIASSAWITAQAEQRARLPARQELLWHGRVPVLLDGTHVASSLAAVLAEAVHDPRLRGPPVVLLALGREKPADSILKALRAATETLVCTTVASGPLRAAETLAEDASRAGFVAETAADPTSALTRAATLAGKEGWVLAAGSFHLAGVLRPILDRRPPDPAA